MKTIKTTLVYAIMAISLFTFSHCSSDDTNPCDALECFNGGEMLAGTDGCQCDCPPGYSGANCEKPECPVTVECPGGKSPNPDNNCACE